MFLSSLSLRARIIAGIILTVVVAGLVLAGWSVWSQQLVEVRFASGAQGVEAKLYRVNADDHEISPEDQVRDQKPLALFKNSSSIKVRKGDYFLQTNSTNDYATQSTSFAMDSEPKTIEVNPVYSDNKLNSLLQAETPNIKRALEGKYPSTLAHYELAKGKLFDHGEWYGSTLRIKLTQEQARTTYVDIYRLVMYKVGGGWELLTAPPELVLSRLKYPGIPVVA